ncbi:MAG: TAXI family TRAP transporter solute-binding subunit [Sideroxyarcus sp.]|nr:TAXI family TRAP transporter solute-binding subunit [Sideroxyarcus sp.]
MKKRPYSEEELADTRVSLPLEAFKAALPYLVALLLIAILGYWLIDPAPPKKIVISISKEDGNYQAYAHLYRELLGQEGIELEIRESEGPLSSLGELRDAGTGVDMAFVPGGVAASEPTVGLVSLGSLYYEPLWIFSREQRRIELVSALKGKRIAVGRTGSGTNILSQKILHAAGVNAHNSTFYEIGEDDAKEALRHNVADVIFLSGVPTSPLIEEVAALPGVALLDLNEAEAYSRQFNFLHHLVLPQGALSLESNIPPRKADLLAPTVTLVARESMHPALVYLVLKVLTRVHGGAGMLQKDHDFPSDKDTDFEMSSQAAHFYESGPPFLDRYLPFWAATFVSRVLIIILPLLALAIPLSRIAPAAYSWLVKSRIHRLYGELRFLEMQLRDAQQPPELATFRKELDAIENKVNHLRLPVAFSSHLYELRSHIELVRSKLSRA